MSKAEPVDAQIPITTTTRWSVSIAGRRTNFGDALFRFSTMVFVLSTLLIVGGVFWVLLRESWLSITTIGWKFLTNQAFDPNNNIYGVAPAIFGTLVTSAFALLFAVPLGVGTAVFLVEICPRPLRQSLAFLADLLATLPSVILGLWGYLVLAPWLQKTGEPWLHAHLGFLPFFHSPPQTGLGLLAAGMILTIMVMPFIISISREVMLIVPNEQREALLALGATRWEVVRHALLPSARIGIFGGIILGLGRALGETMAVTMVIGNQANQPSPNLFANGYTLSSVIANQFNEATPGIFRSAVLEAGVIVLVITLITNLLARLLVASMGRRTGGLVA